VESVSCNHTQVFTVGGVLIESFAPSSLHPAFALERQGCLVQQAFQTAPGVGLTLQDACILLECCDALKLCDAMKPVQETAAMVPRLQRFVDDISLVCCPAFSCLLKRASPSGA
jgi:hypothetical protein